MGGTLAELLDDVSIRIPPLRDDEIRAALRDLRGARLLSGYRDEPARDVDALVQAVAGLSRLLADIGDDIADIDVNPLIVGARGAGSVVVDSLVLLRTKGGT
jgi:hypothetical protein